MLRSMTGFGAGTAAVQGLSVRAEVRSVNHRHLLTKQRLPPEVSHLESEVEGVLKKKLARGSVTVSVQLARDGGAAAARIDPEVAAEYHGQLEQLARELGLAAGPALGDLLGLPGVVCGRDGDDDTDRVAKLVLRAVGAATTELVAMREHEGRALADDLDKNAVAVERVVARIERRMPKVVREHHANLKRRVEDLAGAPGAVDGADLAREVALLADRLDVSEELSRLASHLEQLRKLIAKGGTVGRKLDFLAQEFFREANTIGSKCNDAKVAHDVVDLKTHIERLREQVQNVE